MARAADIEIDPFESFAAAGARIVAVRGQELFEHSEGVLDTRDIERVHAMRVASRRLRAVLEIFAPVFERRAYKDVLSDVKQLADALGERRDPDVHIDAMNAFAESVGAQQRRGVQTLTERLRERQTAGNEILAAALADAERSDLAGRIQRLAETALTLVPAPEPVFEPEAELEPEPFEPEPEPEPELAA